VGPVQSPPPDPAPAPITTLTVQDRPGDNGGIVMIDWTGYEPPGDFAHYYVYAKRWDFSDVSGMYRIFVIDDPAQTSKACATGSDEWDYWFAVTCADTDGNENTVVQTVGPVHSEAGP